MGLRKRFFPYFYSTLPALSVHKTCDWVYIILLPNYAAICMCEKMPSPECRARRGNLIFASDITMFFMRVLLIELPCRCHSMKSKLKAYLLPEWMTIWSQESWHYFYEFDTQFCTRKYCGVHAGKLAALFSSVIPFMNIFRRDVEKFPMRTIHCQGPLACSEHAVNFVLL